jgi:uncharacterized membrane protein YeiB
VPSIGWLSGAESALVELDPVAAAFVAAAAVLILPLGTYFVTFFLTGLLLGRLAVARPRLAPVLAVIGAAAGAGGLAVLAGLGLGPDDWVISGSGGVVVTYVQWLSVLGFDVAAVGACLWLGRLAGGRAPALLRPLARTGSMALTAFVAHAVVFALVFTRYAVTFEQAMWISLTYIATIVVLTNAWALSGRRGPLEDVMRRFSGPWRPLRRGAEVTERARTAPGTAAAGSSGQS